MNNHQVDRHPVGSDAINQALVPYGIKLQTALITPGGLVSFSRAADAEHPDRDVLGSYVMARMAVNAKTLAVPRAFAKDIGRSFAHVSVSDGWTADDSNRHGPGAALVTQRRHHALGVPWADAPGGVFIHAPTGILFTIAGIWQFLAENSVEQTFALLGEQVEEATGESLRPQDVWGLVSPGAHAAAFYVNQKGYDLLAAADARNKKFLPAAQPTDLEVARKGDPYGLNLTDLFLDYIRREGVPQQHVFVDWRDTVTDPSNLPSKRRADALGLPYHSGLLIGAVHELN